MLNQRQTTSDDLGAMRGRTMDRSLARTNEVIGKPRLEDASNLRGRSRRRAASPLALRSISRSRNASPSFASSIIYHRLKDSSRRDHCPSRPANNQSSPQRRVNRTRSRSRNAPRTITSPAEALHRSLVETHSSGLREVMISEDMQSEDTAMGEDAGETQQSSSATS